MSVYSAARGMLYDKSSDSGLVGSVFKLDGGQTEFITDVQVPMFDYANSSKRRLHELNDAGDGRYFMQLLLPDGRVEVQSFEISKGTDSDVIFELEHRGPHEWTGLEAMRGEVYNSADERNAAGSGLDTVDDGVPQSYADLRSDPENGFALSFLKSGANFGSNDVLGEKALNRLSLLIEQDADVETAIHALGSPDEVASRSEEDNRYAKFEFVHSGLKDPSRQGDNYYFGPGSDNERTYLVLRSSRGGTLISLPTPWMGNNDEAEVSLLLDKSTLPDELSYSLTIADPMVNSALGYINAGALHQAARLIDFKRAEQMLFEKMSRPMTAVVGGYLLVLGLNRVAYRSESDRWQQWLENLDHWFEWLPDGAILNASLYFMLGDDQRDKSYDALMRAYDRGLPYFSFGLKFMLDGLRRFSAQGDSEAKAKLKRLELVAATCDSSQPFLAVDFSHRWKHQSEPEHSRVLVHG